MESWRADSSDGVVAGPQLIDWERSHPLLNLVELGNVLVVDSLIVDPPPGGQVLIDSTKGGVFAIAPRDAYEDAVLGFEIVGRDDEGNVTVNTNWPRSFGFPNFCLNVLEYLAGGAAADESSNSKPGESVELRLRDQTDAVTVTMPDGERREVDRGDDERYLFHDTQQLGIYEVSQGRETLWRFAVNLFDREESDVALRERFDEAANVKTVDSLSIGFVDVEAERTERPAREELWKWLLLASLVVLVVEWYIYNRRVYI